MFGIEVATLVVCTVTFIILGGIIVGVAYGVRYLSGMVQRMRAAAVA